MGQHVAESTRMCETLVSMEQKGTPKTNCVCVNETDNKTQEKSSKTYGGKGITVVTAYSSGRKCWLVG
jgi:hypothetical protein